MLQRIVDFFLGISSGLGYWGVLLLMAVESSFIPFPSEIVVPPAAYLAARGEMNIFIVVIMGILGSLIGASINYFLARWLGRPIIYTLVEKKWAKYFLLSPAKLEKAEKHFRDYGGISTFIGRLIPAVRQLISIPAGFSRMNFGKFLFFTFLGSGFWVIVLAALGYFFGANEGLWMFYLREISYGLIFIALLTVLILYLRKRKKRRLVV